VYSNGWWIIGFSSFKSDGWMDLHAIKQPKKPILGFCIYHTKLDGLWKGQAELVGKTLSKDSISSMVYLEGILLTIGFCP
jgi:hypothetical protein